MKWPPLVPDVREWDSLPGDRVLGLLIEVDPTRMSGLEKARAVLEQLPVVIHPDHYLHVTLRTFGPPGSVDGETKDAIAHLCASTPRWVAEVRGLNAFPTAIWADPDADGQGRLAALEDRTLASLGTLAESPMRDRAIAHLTLAYSIGTASPESVRLTLEPHHDLLLGTIEVTETVLAETHLTAAYPEWTVLERFPLR